MMGRALVACAAWFATLTAAAAILPLVDSGTWLVQAGFLLAVQTGLGMMARARGAHAALTVPFQVLVSVALITVTTAREQAVAGLIPGPEAFSEFGLLLTSGADDIGHYVAPAPVTDGILLILLTGVLLIGLLVDLLAVGLNSAAAAGLPLLALYSVAAGVGQEGASWPYFLLAATGYLALLLAEGSGAVSRWGGYFSGPGGPRSAIGRHRPWAAPLVRTGRRVGAATLGIALLAPVLLPSLGDGLLDLDSGGRGRSSGAESMTAVNAVVALQDQLNQPQDRPVLTYRSSADQPGEMYLRMVALDDFDGAEWRSSEQFADGVPATPWPVTGLSDAVDAAPVSTEISGDHSYAQMSLPVPYPAVSIDAVGEWRYDAGSQTLVSGDAGLTTQGLDYRVDHLLVSPSAEQLASAPAPDASLGDHFTEVPANLPPQVAQMAEAITVSASNTHEQAVALQQWFTSEGGFRYDTSVTSGTGSEAIVSFLEQREGFCVHFAFTMAAMARTLNIPAQVAVGFTPGGRQSDGSYQVGIHNAHAWPELYFEGIGWTRFEPTPGQGSPPEYSRPGTTEPDTDDLREEAEDDERESPEQPEAPLLPEPDECDPASEDSACGSFESPAVSDREEGVAWLWPVVWAGGGALLVVALTLTPLLWRTRTRARRLAEPAHPLAAWQEIQDTAWDYGIPPRASETPRQSAERIVQGGNLDAQESAALHRIASAVEETLYASEPGVLTPSWQADVRSVRAGLRATAGRWERARAFLLPRSSIRVIRQESARQNRWRGRARNSTARARNALRPPSRRA